MAAFKLEIPIYHLVPVDKIRTKFQRFIPCFQGSAIQWYWWNCLTILPAEIQDDVLQGGNTAITDRNVNDNSFVFGVCYLMWLVRMMYNRIWRLCLNNAVWIGSNSTGRAVGNDTTIALSTLSTFLESIYWLWPVIISTIKSDIENIGLKTVNLLSVLGCWEELNNISEY